MKHIKLISTLSVIAVAAVAIYCSVFRHPSSQGVNIPQTITHFRTDTGAWTIHYHIDQGVLSYAVILGPAARSTGGWVRGGTTTDGIPFVQLWQPGDKLTSLVGSGRIFQVVDPDYGTNRGVHGQVTELSERISGTTFQAFLDSKPSSYSLASLTNYSKTHQ